MRQSHQSIEVAIIRASSVLAQFEKMMPGDLRPRRAIAAAVAGATAPELERAWVDGFAAAAAAAEKTREILASSSTEGGRQVARVGWAAVNAAKAAAMTAWATLKLSADPLAADDAAGVAIRFAVESSGRIRSLRRLRRGG